MWARSIVPAEARHDRGSGFGNPADATVRGSDPGDPAGLPDRGGAERARLPGGAAVRVDPAMDAPGYRRLSAGGRPEHRLRAAELLRRPDHQRLQRLLYRARDSYRAADADEHPVLPRDVPGHDVRH